MAMHVYNYNAAGSDSNTLTNILFTPSFQRNKIITLSTISTHVLVIKCVILFSENPQAFRISLYLLDPKNRTSNNSQSFSVWCSCHIFPPLTIHHQGGILVYKSIQGQQILNLHKHIFDWICCPVMPLYVTTWRRPCRCRHKWQMLSYYWLCSSSDLILHNDLIVRNRYYVKLTWSF